MPIICHSHERRNRTCCNSMCTEAYQVYMLWVLIAVDQLGNVGMVRNEVENLDLSLYVCHVFLLHSRADLVS